MDKKTILMVAVTAAVVCVVGVVGYGYATRTTDFPLRGSIMLFDSTGRTGSGPDCEGVGGFSDINEGAPVKVHAADGEVLAIGSLGPGVWYNGCRFKFTVEAPDGHDFYQVEVSNRGLSTVSNEDAKNGRVDLSLG